MVRYRSRAWIADDGDDFTPFAEPKPLTIHVEERASFTGLYDANGHEIHREPEPIGFDLSAQPASPRPPKTQGEQSPSGAGPHLTTDGDHPSTT